MATIEEIKIVLRADLKAAEDLKERVKAYTDAFNALRLELAKGTLSKQEYEKELARLITRFDKATQGTNEFASKQRSMVLALSDSKAGVERLNVAMSNVSMNLGRANMTLLQTGRLISDLPFGIMGIANNIPMIVEGFQRMEVQVTASGVAISRMRQLMMSLAGPGGVMLAVSAFSGLLIILPKIVEWFGASAEATAKQTEELRKQNAELLKNIGLQEKLGLLPAGATQAEAARQLTESLKQINALEWERINVSEEVARLRVQIEKETNIESKRILMDRYNTFYAREQELIKLLDPNITGTPANIRLDAEQALQDEYKKGSDVQQKGLSDLAAMEASYYEWKLDQLDKLTQKQLKAFGINLQGGPKIFGGEGIEPQQPWYMKRAEGPAPIPKGLESEPGEVGLKEKGKEVKSFTEQMADGFASATDVLAQGFVKAFGLGDSLLDQFLATFLGNIAQTGLNFLTGGLFSLIGLQHGGVIREPVVGRGLKTGTMYTLAESGPEYVTPAHSQALAMGSMSRQMNNLSDSIANGVWRMKGNDIVYTYDRNKRIIQGRRY